MSKDNKKIFISYRRSASQYFSRSVFMHLDYAGYDTFMDIKSINAGEFERIIKGQIAAREHFLVILAPGSMERLENPDDWLRKEIELALDLERNIIPVLHGGFKFEEHGEKLTGKLERLSALNGLPVYDEYFDEAMERLCERYLEKPIYVEITKITQEEENEAAEAIAEARDIEKPTEDDLSAEEYFNKGYEASTPEEEIKYYTLAIEKKLDYGSAYNNRGIAYSKMEQHERAIEDYDKAIELDPNYATAYNNRAVSRNLLGNSKQALADVEQALALEPEEPIFHGTKGEILHDMENFEEAVEWYDKFLALDPDYVNDPVKEWREQALTGKPREPKE